MRVVIRGKEGRCNLEMRCKMKSNDLHCARLPLVPLSVRFPSAFRPLSLHSPRIISKLFSNKLRIPTYFPTSPLRPRFRSERTPIAVYPQSIRRPFADYPRAHTAEHQTTSLGEFFPLTNLMLRGKASDATRRDLTAF